MFPDSYIKKAIRKYKNSRNSHEDTYIQHIVNNQHDTTKVIEIAASAVDTANRLHSHQYRVGKKVLAKFGERLLEAASEVTAAKNFDSIYSAIESKKIDRVGDLTIYDTALRIAYSKPGCMPDKIYLHTGTRTGVRNIVPKLANRKYILKSDLPAVLSNSDLTPAELEDLLCHISSGNYIDCSGGGTSKC